jgi:hypothetical protein
MRPELPGFCDLVHMVEGNRRQATAKVFDIVDSIPL